MAEPASHALDQAHALWSLADANIVAALEYPGEDTRCISLT